MYGYGAPPGTYGYGYDAYGYGPDPYGYGYGSPPMGVEEVEAAFQYDFKWNCLDILIDTF